MKFVSPLVEGRFLRRYKRFFVDVELSNGEQVVAHCPNTGSLRGCLEEGARVLLVPVADEKRTLKFGWKLIEIADGWVGVDTGLAVPLVEEAIGAGLLPKLTGYPNLYREVRYGRTQTSRIDILLSRGGTQPPSDGKRPRKAARVLPEGDERVYIEVKNTTLVQDGVAMFPDAVTERGQKHLEELIDVVQSGQRAAMVFCIQRTDCARFAPADAIDPVYGKLLRAALASGVEAYALRVRPSPTAIAIDALLEIVT